MKALADACHKQGIKLFFYYSLLDWHHPDYFPRGQTGQTAGREEQGDWKTYVAYYQGQVRELCTNYGEIGGIWFDGWWDRPDADWDLAGTYRIIHELQPGALVGNNHHVAPFPGEDFQMFEQDLPGENSAGFNKAGVTLEAAARDLPDDEPVVGLQRPGQPFQVARTGHSCPAGSRWPGRQPAAERRPAARRHDRARIQRAAGGRGEVAGGQRQDGLRHAPGTDRSPSLGRFDHQSSDASGRLFARPQAGGLDYPTQGRSATFTPFAFGKTTPLKLVQRGEPLELALPESARTPIDTIIVLSPLGYGR